MHQTRACFHTRDNAREHAQGEKTVILALPFGLREELRDQGPGGEKIAIEATFVRTLPQTRHAGRVSAGLYQPLDDVPQRGRFRSDTIVGIAGLITDRLTL